MPDKPISPLRQRMIDHMTARGFSEKVRKAYVRHVKAFAAFLGRSLDTATSEDLRRFQLHAALRARLCRDRWEGRPRARHRRRDNGRWPVYLRTAQR
jgi:hypothetical protein